MSDSSFYLQNRHLAKSGFIAITMTLAVIVVTLFHLVYIFFPPEYYVAQHGSESAATWVSVFATLMFATLMFAICRRYSRHMEVAAVLTIAICAWIWLKLVRKAF